MKILLSILLFLFTITAFAQQFGGNPSNIRWRQINTDTVRIIFPEGLNEEALRVSSIVHELQKSHSGTIGEKLKKINIVLQNQNTVSNAYVALGPFRSEFFMFAPQNSFELGSLNWADNLSLHEYRHVQQYNNFDVGWSKVVGTLFGQQGRALANAAAIPDWFFEGDAVFNETSLSKQGRGRLPYFFNGYSSLSNQKKRYSYEKLRNGSFKNFVPNHYPLGYMLVGYGREKYGADFWKKVTRDAAGFKPFIYPFQHAISKYSNKPFKKFVRDAFDFYEQKWKQQKSTPFQLLTTLPENTVTNYQYPYWDENGNLIVLKSSNKQIPAFYLILPDGTEQKIAVRDISNDNYFSYNHGKIVYNAYRADNRWGYREYSDIKILDLETEKLKKITKKGRYFSPDIAHNGQKIVAVEMATNMSSNMVTMNMNGEVLFRKKIEKGNIFTYPKFSYNDQHIYVTARNEKGLMALLKIEERTGKETIVLPYANRIIGLPTVHGDTVLFTSSFTGSDEAWAYVESKNETFRLAVNTTGLYHPTYHSDSGKLIAANFSADGFRLIAIKEKDLLWQKVNEKENALPDLFLPVALQQENNATLQNMHSRNFAISKYSKGYNLFNFHSIRPNFDDPEISLTLLGENVLNTFQSELSYTYNRNETSHSIGFNAIYGGSYVQPVVGINQAFSRNVVYNTDTSFTYNEFNAKIGLRLPINFSSGMHYTYLTLNTSINNQLVQWQGTGKELLKNQRFFYMQHSINFTNSIQLARQHIYPHFAQSVLLQYRNIVEKYTAHQFLASGVLYLPGILPTHNIVFSAAWQSRDTLGQYSFANNFPFSRGYNGFNFPRMWRFGSNYHFPLIYPDWGFGGIVYFKRLRANAFYDYSVIKSLRTGNSFSFSTIGGELFFDTRWWNQQEVTFGVRYSYLQDANLVRRNPNQWEIILPVGLWR